jgi:tetratricopeptide (TPR) repeat protein
MGAGAPKGARPDRGGAGNAGPRRGGTMGARQDPGRAAGAWRDRAAGAGPRRAGPAGRSPGRDGAPPIPDRVTADQLQAEARAELRTLPADLADSVARRLVAAELEEDAERAYAHAHAAHELAARVGVVREVSGVAAYRAGRWAEALSELRAARRLTGRNTYLPVMADAERALGRLDRALALTHSAEAGKLNRAAQIELLIVESGIRRDQGSPEAAAVVLQVPELTDGRLRPWSPALFYAYADALLEAGRAEDARDWFGRAAAVDTDEETDALERLQELDGITVEDLGAPDDDDGE